MRYLSVDGSSAGKAMLAAGLLAACLAAWLGAATPAFADEEVYDASSAGRKTGVYVRGAGGVAFAGGLDQDLSWNPAAVFVAAPALSKSTDIGSGLALSAAAGFQYRNTRTELEYRRMIASLDGVDYVGGAAPAVVPAHDDFKVDALMSNVYFDFVNSSALTPYLGVGVGGARVRNELGERDAAFAFQGRAGIDYALSRNLSLGAEYVYFRTLNLVYGPEEFDPVGPAGPRTDGDGFSASSVMGTLRLVF